MIKVEQKTIKKQRYLYLTERVRDKNTYKKIQVYLGKTVPKDMAEYYSRLENKEWIISKAFIEQEASEDSKLVSDFMPKLLRFRLQWKYYIAQKSTRELKKFWRNFAIQFIFESNAIEGSRLSNKEVSSIVNKEYVSKSAPRAEVQEVYNSIEAFNFIRNHDFTLSQKNIKKLHFLITKELPGYEPGKYKTKAIMVNNKETLDASKVKTTLEKLIRSYKKNLPSDQLFIQAVVFHNSFEFIHPFTDGNGRVGRMILLWMLFHSKHGVILFKKQNMQSYFKAMSHADEGRSQKLILYAIETYIKTVKEFAK